MNLKNDFAGQSPAWPLDGQDRITVREFHGAMPEPVFEAFYAIMTESFPGVERRTREDQRALLRKPAYRVWMLEDEGREIGFLAFWRFADFIYGEHFAFRNACRGKGVGTRVLRRMLRESLPLVGEVEPPDTEQARRRIALYAREGFTVYPDYAYWQQPLRRGDPPTPLLLMSSRADETPQTLDRYRDVLYREVYGVCPGGAVQP